MALTNLGLVSYAKKCLALGNDTIYVYGTFGQELSANLINQKAKQYAYNIARKSIYNKALASSGKEYAFDCVGLIKSYIWGGYGNTKYNASQDKSANGMYNTAKVKGKMNTMPEKPGILVHMNGHIGIYIGNKYVIECTPSTKFATQNHKGGGVCKTKLSDRKWTGWCECPYITYEEQKDELGLVAQWQVAMNSSYNCGLEVDNSYGPDSKEKADKYYLKYKLITIKNAHVKFIQKRLVAYGYNISIDGSYGPKTRDAVKKFQKAKGLKRDGFVGANTTAKLLGL